MVEEVDNLPVKGRYISAPHIPDRNIPDELEKPNHPIFKAQGNGVNEDINTSPQGFLVKHFLKELKEEKKPLEFSQISTEIRTSVTI